MLIADVIPRIAANPNAVATAWFSGGNLVVRRGPLVILARQIAQGFGLTLFCRTGKGATPELPTSHVEDLLSRSDAWVTIPQDVVHPAWDALAIELLDIRRAIEAYEPPLAVAAAVIARDYRDRLSEIPSLSVIDRRNGDVHAPTADAPLHDIDSTTGNVPPEKS